MAAQEGDYAYTVDGTPAVATITGYHGGGGAIFVPSTLGSYPVVRIGNLAFYHIIPLTSIVIPDSVVNIGEDAFSKCSALVSVTIGNGTTSIGDGAFSLCASLLSMTIPDNDSSIREGAFALCHS